MADTAQHFTDMIAMYNIDASQGAKPAFTVPVDLQEQRLIAGYLQQIEDLNLQLRKNQDRMEQIERENL
jgi:hypothetical protein